MCVVCMEYIGPYFLFAFFFFFFFCLSPSTRALQKLIICLTFFNSCIDSSTPGAESREDAGRDSAAWHHGAAVDPPAAGRHLSALRPRGRALRRRPRGV